MGKNQPSPPGFFLGFFRWYCHPRMLDYIEGDLLEVYGRRVKEHGKRKADWKFIIDVLLLFRPGIVRPQTGYHHLNTYGMYKNYLKIGWRTLVRNKDYALINIAGLALSVTCCILIFTLVKFHLGFDGFHPGQEQIYRVVTEMHSKTVSYSSGVPTPLGRLLRENHTDAKETARIFTAPNKLITLKKGEALLKFKEAEGVAFTEPAFFDIFHFPLAKGTHANALTEPHTAVITQEMAKKYFGDANPLGESFWLDNEVSFTITGILEDFPPNTDFRAGIYVSYSSLETIMPWLASENFWRGISGAMQCYTVLDPHVSAGQVEEVLATYAAKHPLSTDTKSIYRLQPLTDIHFDAKYGAAMEKKELWMLSAIGIFLLLTACVNFVNLATAQALKRSKEVGIRKVIGGLRWQLFWQFILETAIITTVSMGIAVVLGYLLVPYVNAFFHTELSLNPFADGTLLAFIAGLCMVITLLAGCYPAFILGGFQPVTALKGKLSQQHIGGFNTRRTLIIGQFAISQVFVISLLVVMSQMRFARQAELGFDRESIVMVKTSSDTLRTMNALKDEFSRIPGVEKISLCYTAPASSEAWQTDVQLDNSTADLDILANMKLADADYVPTFDLGILAGRNLMPSDTVREVLVNEALLHKFGIHSPEDALGRLLTANNGNIKAPIVGVVRNFHDKSFHEEISPAIFSTGGIYYENFAIKLNTQTVKSSMAEIERIWQDQYPDQLFEYAFVDDNIARFYEAEQAILSEIQVFSFIAIFIGCLGLYGLVSFMVAQKTKEVGIRKVMGSSVIQIVWLFGREFLRLILFAFVIAAPVGWWLMDSWLQDFTFRISLDAWIFALAVGSSVLIAAVTVGYQVVRTAFINPVLSLKTE